MKKKVAIIVGGSGQFGVTISNFLLKKNYKIVVTTRNVKNCKKKIPKNKNIKIQKLDIYNKIQIDFTLKKYDPHLVFYFAGQSSPKKSFYQKKETYRSNVVGCKNFLESILKNKINCRFLNASSCEIYGNNKGKIKLNSPKKPISPYGFAKLKSFEITKKFRIKHNLKSFNAIIFNTESIYRDRTFLIPKICIAAINAKKYDTKTEFGDLSISREWNWCEEQVGTLLKFLNKKPQDFMLSNGKNYSALQMISFAFEFFNIKYTDYVLFNKKYLRKNDSKNMVSGWDNCLKRNNIKRNVSTYGKKIIIKLIKNYSDVSKFK